MTNDVQLSVYDLSGKKVSTLVFERQQIGNYSVNFDARGLSSGIYFYQLYANGKLVGNKKMMFLK